MKTQITNLLDIKYPIVQGGLQNVAYPELCAAVSEAGALGTLSATLYSDPRSFRDGVRKVKSLTKKSFCVNLSLLPGVNVGDSIKEYIDICGDEEVRAIETSGVKPDVLSQWIREKGIVHLHKAPSTRHALSAEKSGADAVSCVGFECAGHPGADNIGTMVLVREASQKCKVPIIAGGGIVDGYGLAAALSLGAEGIIMGTRFLATEEAPISAQHKQWILNATERDTLIIQQSIKNQARVAKNQAAKECLELESQGATLEELLPIISGARGKAAYVSGDVEDGIFSMGVGCSIITQILPVKEVVEEIVRDAEKSLNRLNQLMRE